MLPAQVRSFEPWLVWDLLSLMLFSFVSFCANAFSTYGILCKMRPHCLGLHSGCWTIQFNSYDSHHSGALRLCFYGGQRGYLRHLPTEPRHRATNLHQPQSLGRTDRLLHHCLFAFWWCSQRRSYRSANLSTVVLSQIRRFLCGEITRMQFTYLCCALSFFVLFHGLPVSIFLFF